METLKLTIAISLLAGAMVSSSMGGAEAPKKEPYPLTTCVVSDEKLGSMGKAFIYVHKDPKIKDDPGREVQFCCEACVKDFQKEPAKYLKKIDEAAAKAKK